MPRERENAENAIEDQPSAPMDFAMILKATDNFSQEIGHGGFGYVYKVKKFVLAFHILMHACIIVVCMYC